MTNLLKILIGIVLVLLALAFFAFAVQNSADVLVVLLPGHELSVPVYLLVLSCVFAGFMSAVVVTRFEYIKAKFNVVRLLKKFKRNKNKSKYVSE
tara:strand:+ start:2380 stop:2664 length:285 start_codon:yes stop_codon:yes gene_type:complete